MNFVRNLALAVAVVLLPAAAMAQANTPHVDHRQANQQQRIDQGKATGQLTSREARRLQHGQRHVQNLETRAKADGNVTKRERARLRTAQNVQSKRIARQKHDAQKKV